jgi:hypothetical protein
MRSHIHRLEVCALQLFSLCLLAACASPAVSVTPTPAAPLMPALAATAAPPAAIATAAPTTAAPPAATPTPDGPPPRIGAVTADRPSLGRYERIELTVELTATYDQPFDSQQVALSASFQAPSGRTWEVPGFWDGRDSWRVRFTPSETGAWRYIARVRDRFGAAESSQNSFEVTPSDHHGWLQVASWHDPKLSSRYLVYHDGTPFYGVGHCEAFTLGDARTDANGDLNTLKRMRDNGENLAVWWPHFGFTFFGESVSNYERVDLLLIDSYLASAERLGMVLVYTVWHHDLLRGPDHPWGRGNWNLNGFRKVTPKAEDFFTDVESWRWQENLYRYIIARWGYSPAIMWMTVSELNGTSVGSQQDVWHAKINDYFVHNDPYRHPTTASLSGDQFWPAGYAVMDVPQVHVYAAQKDAIKMGDSVADWTARLWQDQARPNVVGEFGTTNSRIDLPLVHNSIWGALASGAAITPLRWADRGAWGRTRDTVMAQLGHLGTFVADIPFPSLDLKSAQLRAEGTRLTARGLSSGDYALAWVQDRKPGEIRTGASLTIGGMNEGAFTIQPFDTWTGQTLAEQTVRSAAGELTIALPAFSNDIALKIVKAP